jgi:murein DD-endopeptidase MepM/ murein hydrolase activator NlpD
VVGPVHFGAAHHDYPATDIFARCGARVVAPVDGTILEVERTDRWNPATNRGGQRGGLSFTVLGRDGVRYYGSHLRALVPGLHAGLALRAGDAVGRVGNTGDARGIDCHVHFGVSPVCRGTGDWWIRRGAVAPYPFLRSWQHGGRLSPARAVRRWEHRHGCGRAASPADP